MCARAKRGTWRVPRVCRPLSQLAGTSSASILELLRIFAFGTWADYKARAAELPELSEAQAIKLKKLTVVARAAESKLLMYDVLMRELEVRTRPCETPALVRRV